MSGAFQRWRHIRALARAAVLILETDASVDVAGAASLVGVSTGSVYVAWRVEHPDRPPRGRRITERMREARTARFSALCDVMLDHVPSRDVATAKEIFAATLDDYGSCHERRLWRAMRRLVDQGRVLRRDCTYRRAA